MKIKAILSDLDKTLIEDALVPEQVIRVVKTYLEVSQEKAAQIVQDFYDTQTTRAHFLNGYSKIGAWKQVFSQNNLDITHKQIYELNDLFWKTAASFARPYPGVLETIAELKKEGYLFGIVSGGDYMTRYQHIKETGILPFADVIVTTEEIGQVKHTRNLYSVAADELGVSYTQTATVGDNEMADIVLPKEEGFITVKIDREERPTAAHFRIESFTEVPRILEELSFQKTKLASHN